MISQGGIRVNLTPKMRQSLLNVTPRSQMMLNFTFSLHKYDSKKRLNRQQVLLRLAPTLVKVLKRSHATTPRIFKLRAEDLRRGVHGFHPGWYREIQLSYKCCWFFFPCYITKHLMCTPSGNSEFCFPSSLNVSLDFVSGNIETLRKTKLTISLWSTH